MVSQNLCNNLQDGYMLLSFVGNGRPNKFEDTLRLRRAGGMTSTGGADFDAHTVGHPVAAGVFQKSG